MPDRDLEGTAEEAARLLGSRAVPSTRFIHTLGQDIQYAAYQRLGQPSIPLHEMVIELRKLIRMLRRTLVPVCARAGYARALGEDLDAAAHEMIVIRQQRVRWLVLGGALGSALSLLGVLAAVLLRRRNGRAHAGKPLGLG
jgi:hypothetical protein